ncbi:MAG: PAS domain S-box protein [Chloroflexi bacterium]|nr:PAS domain S-box protein [Chloroflexota bacterium]HOA24416.1 PAS domain S-box protein [Aggregatilineales bacterium]
MSNEPDLSFRSLWQGPSAKAALGSLAMFLLLLVVWWRAGVWYREQLIVQRRGQLLAQASIHGSDFASAINQRISRLQALRAYVETEYDNPQFRTHYHDFAAELYVDALGVRHFALAPGGVVRYVYPEDENQFLIGSDLLNDRREEVRQDAEQAIQSGRVVLSGPYELLQGGQGLLARQAVYINWHYWGLVSITIDMQLALDEANISPSEQDFQLAIRNGEGKMVYGSAATFEQDPVVSAFRVGDETWQLAAVPHGGWGAAVERSWRLFQVAGLGVVGMLAVMTYAVINRQTLLALAVEQRTRQLSRVNEQLQQDIAERLRTEALLREREEQYRGVFESSIDGLFINDPETHRLVDFNPAAHLMHGYTEEEFRQLQPADFIHPDFIGVFDKYMATVRKGKEFRSLAVDVRKDGTPFYVEVLGTVFTYRGKPHTLAVVRDVDEQMKAYELLEQRVEERTRELVSLLEVSRSVASTLELDPLLGVILDQLKNIVNYMTCVILTVDDDGSVQVRAHRGLEALPENVRHLPTTRAMARTIVDTQSPVVIPDVRDDSEMARAFRKRVPPYSDADSVVGSWLGVPLIVRDRVVGVLALAHGESNRYSSTTADLVMAFANEAAVAIENARLYVEAQDAAAIKERQKLARELHDSVSQALYGIALGARTARTVLARAGDGTPVASQLTEPLDYILSLAEAGLAEMRALIFELRPESLQKEGLVAALGKQAAAIQARHQIEVDTVLGDEPDVLLNVKETLYRVAQEALHNVTKHARASRVDLALREADGMLTLEIRDDGQGFDTGGDFPGHLGLRSMRERVEGVGGTLEIESAPGEGTCVRARLPAQPRLESAPAGAASAG